MLSRDSRQAPVTGTEWNALAAYNRAAKRERNHAAVEVADAATRLKLASACSCV